MKTKYIVTVVNIRTFKIVKIFVTSDQEDIDECQESLSDNETMYVNELKPENEK